MIYQLEIVSATFSAHRVQSKDVQWQLSAKLYLNHAHMSAATSVFV